MPVLRLHFPEELVSKENFEDVLTLVNKNISDASKQFKSKGSWMAGVLRNYAIGSHMSRMRWESSKVLVLGDRTLKVPNLVLWKGADIDELDDKLEGEMVILGVGDLQFKYLLGAVEWENTYQKEIVKSGIEHPNVARLCQYIVLNTLLQVQVQIDLEKMQLEEKELEEKEE